MFGTIVALLMVLAHGSAQLNTSCVQIVDSSDAGGSPYPDDEPSLTFTMEGATNLKTNTVSLFENQQLLRWDELVVARLLRSQHNWFFNMIV